MSNPSGPPQKPRRRAGALELVDYAPIGDGRSVAVSGQDGSIDWWGVHAIDGPPLFDRLLGGAGHFLLCPADPFTVTRRYRPDSNVLETVFLTDTGRARLTESLNSGLAGRLPWSELARRVDGLEGEVRFKLRLQAESASGHPTRMTRRGDDVLLSGAGLNLVVRAHPQVRLRVSRGAVTGGFAVAANQRMVVALIANRSAPVALTPISSIDSRIDESDSQWRRWANKLTYDGLYGPEVRRSALALKLLLYSPSGAIAAAATTSLPERVGGDKNWDYRFAWTRDVAYSIKALLRVGAYEEAQAALAWLYQTIRRNGLDVSVLYTLDGEACSPEKRLALPGYRASQPVRVGNRAQKQLQLGIYGDILAAARDFVSKGHQLDEAAIALLSRVADLAARRWRRKDSGMWELMEQAHYTMSKIGCWVALDAAISLGQRGVLDGRKVAGWQRERNRLSRWIEQHCWSEERRAYVMTAGGSRLDAALLLAAPLGYPEHARLDSTRQAIQAQLGRGPLLYRYSGMEHEEGCFLACSFWCVETLAICGHAEAARTLMDQAVEIAASDQGVYHEMIDVDSGQMLGNFPQGLSHLAMIHAAEAVTRAFHRPT